MTTDPKDAEIARYNLTGYDRGTEAAHEGAWVRHSDHATEIARLRKMLDDMREETVRLNKATDKQYAQTLERLKAERDAKSKWLGELLAVIHRDGGQYQDEHGDEKAVRDAHLIVADLRAERDRRDAQMRAEGLRRALDVVSENADWPEDEHGRTEHPALFARISHAILAAAEKEASP